MNKDAVAEMSQQYQVETAENLVPEGYKQTEVGVIPEDWDVVYIGDVCELLTGFPFPSKSYSSSGVRLLRGSNVKRNTTDWNDDITQYWPAIDASIKQYELKAGDIVIAMDGSLVGRSFAQLNKSDLPALLLQRVARVRSNVASQNYIKEWICSRFFTEHCDSVKTVTAIPHISPDDIKSFRFLLPRTKKEQKNIANALSDTDTLLSELEKLIAKKQAIKTATMQQLLTGRTRLPQFAHHPDGSKKGYRQSELGEIPEDWEVIQLGEIATFIKGAGLPKSDLIDSGKNRCIHYGQLFTTYGPKIEKILSSTDIDGSIKSEINDILMPTSDVTPNGLATASCILESGIVLGGDILIIRSKKELLDGVFFAYLITVMRDQVMQLVTGSTVYHLYGSDMAKFLFAKPVFEEQTTIATILSDMDKEIQALEQRLTKTRQIKQGMMQELLTGRTRLL